MDQVCFGWCHLDQCQYLVFFPLLSYPGPVEHLFFAIHFVQERYCHDYDFGHAGYRPSFYQVYTATAYYYPPVYHYHAVHFVRFVALGHLGLCSEHCCHEHYHFHVLVDLPVMYYFADH